MKEVILITITGPTASGKSTLLHNLIDMLKVNGYSIINVNPDRHSIAIESGRNFR